ncbi:hypothetical protein BX600DRAFT_443550 [Xylariales sp. PMI_506]|nr:hypothetical protein BX600DRAFT_443550 [Xylariales sp. PMI_506]
MRALELAATRFIPQRNSLEFSSIGNPFRFGASDPLLSSDDGDGNYTDLREYSGTTSAGMVHDQNYSAYENALDPQHLSNPNWGSYRSTDFPNHAEQQHRYDQPAPTPYFPTENPNDYRPGSFNDAYSAVHDQSANERDPQSARPHAQASSSVVQDGTSSRRLKGPVTCLECQQTFPRRTELHKHITKHNPTIRCLEPGCSKAFRTNRDRDRHVRAKHSYLAHLVRPDGGPCELCGKPISRNDNLERHKDEQHGGMNMGELRWDFLRLNGLLNYGSYL